MVKQDRERVGLEQWRQECQKVLGRRFRMRLRGRLSPVLQRPGQADQQEHRQSPQRQGSRVRPLLRGVQQDRDFEQATSPSRRPDLLEGRQQEGRKEHGLQRFQCPLFLIRSMIYVLVQVSIITFSFI